MQAKSNSTLGEASALRYSLTERIETACATTEARTPAGRKALAQIKWRLKFGLLYAGLDGGRHVLVSADDPRCMVFDGRDNEALKAKWYGIHLGCKFEVDLCH